MQFMHIFIVIVFIHGPIFGFFAQDTDQGEIW